MRAVTTQAERRLWHDGDGTPWSGHRTGMPFDFWCVAHGEDYSPKYLDGERCHDSMGEGYCHPGCNLCPRPCAIEPCPKPEDE